MIGEIQEGGLEMSHKLENFNNVIDILKKRMEKEKYKTTRKNVLEGLNGRFDFQKKEFIKLGNKAIENLKHEEEMKKNKGK